MYDVVKVQTLVESVFAEPQERKCVLVYHRLLMDMDAALRGGEDDVKSLQTSVANALFAHVNNPFSAIMMPIVRVAFLNAMHKVCPPDAFVNEVVPALGSIVNGRNPSDHWEIADRIRKELK